MNYYELRAGWIELFEEGNFTHSFTLKPRELGGAPAGEAYQITSEGQKYQISHATISRSSGIKTDHLGYSDDNLRRKLYHFQKDLDQKLFGSRFYKPQYDHKRTQMIVIAEGDGPTAHLHGVMKVHPTRLKTFSKLFPDGEVESEGASIWSRLMKRGSIKVEEFYSPARWVNYIFKSSGGMDFSDRIMVPPK